MLYINRFKGVTRHAVALNSRCKLMSSTSQRHLSLTHAHEKIATRHAITRQEWMVLCKYTEYVSTHLNELTKEKCTALLLCAGKVVMEQNSLRGHATAVSEAYVWNRGAVHRVPVLPLMPDGDGHLIDSTELLRFIKNLVPIRPYFRLHTQWRLRGTTSVAVPAVQRVTDFPQPQQGYGNMFSRLIGDQSSSKVTNMQQWKTNESCIGPLRLQSERLVALPTLLGDPLYFELNDTTVNGLGNFKVPSLVDSQQVVEKTVKQLLNQLLLFFRGGSDNSTAVEQLCVLAMFMATIIYGTKLRPVDSMPVSDAYRRFHRDITVTVTASDSRVSIMGLAYLLNSCVFAEDVKELGDYVAGRILHEENPIGPDYMENICFALARAGYANDGLYEVMAYRINHMAAELSTTVCLNLLWSFCRLGKHTLVRHRLERAIQDSSPQQMRSLDPKFLRKAVDALKAHVSKETYDAINAHIDVGNGQTYSQL